MTPMKQKRSQTWKATNAIFTIYGFTAGTAIFSVTGVQTPIHAAVWMSPDDLRTLGQALIDNADSIVEEIQ